MSYMKNLALDTRTCGQADEDARLDRRDGLTSTRPHYRRQPMFTPQRRSREEWARINAEHNARQRKIAEQMAERGLSPFGTPLDETTRQALAAEVASNVQEG